MAATWTRPYCGLTYAEFARRRCSVDDRGAFVIAVRYPVLGSTDRYWSDAEERVFHGADAVAEAKRWCESLEQSGAASV